MMCKQQNAKNFFFLFSCFLIFGLLFSAATPALAETGNNVPGPIQNGPQATIPHGNEGACTPGVDIGCVPPPPDNSQPCQNPSGGSCVTPTQGGNNGPEAGPGSCVTVLGIGQFGFCPQNIALSGYLQRMYGFLLAFVAIAAFGGITYGGLLYVFAAGNISSTEEAKKWIWNALIGLIVTAISFILLRTINPDLIGNFNLDLSKYQTQSSTTNLPLDSACDPNNDQCASGSACIPSPGGGGVCRPATYQPL